MVKEEERWVEGEKGKGKGAKEGGETSKKDTHKDPQYDNKGGQREEKI